MEMTEADIRAEIQGIRRRLARIPYSLADVEAREAAERLCQEAQTELSVLGGLAHAKMLVFRAGSFADEVR
jgi:hypothetical protein